MVDADFYRSLPVLSDPGDLTNPELYAPMPGSWRVLVTDIVNSSLAVEQGRYRHVSALGAASIVAVVNLAHREPMPFWFGGDGALVCVPRNLADGAFEALSRLRGLAHERFGLELRVGSVGVDDVQDLGGEIFVARFKASETYLQACFLGGGVELTEQLVKQRHPKARVASDNGNVTGSCDLQGLECRWKEMDSRYEETVAVIVTPRSGDRVGNARILSDTMQAIHGVYGERDHHHPLVPGSLELGLGARVLQCEAELRTAAAHRIKRHMYIMRSRFQVLLAKALMRMSLQTGGVEWGKYKEKLIKNSDVFRIGHSLRQLLAGSVAQRETLQAYLEERYKAGELYYGLHSSKQIHLVCMIHDYGDHHYHFLDGADGGFFLAAKALKAQMSSNEPADATSRAKESQMPLGTPFDASVQ